LKNSSISHFSLEQFNKNLWKGLEALNKEPFKKKEHNTTIGKRRNMN
jgi:hypothetical protein